VGRSLQVQKKKTRRGRESRDQLPLKYKMKLARPITDRKMGLHLKTERERGRKIAEKKSGSERKEGKKHSAHKGG